MHSQDALLGGKIFERSRRRFRKFQRRRTTSPRRAPPLRAHSLLPALTSSVENEKCSTLDTGYVTKMFDLPVEFRQRILSNDKFSRLKVPGRVSNDNSPPPTLPSRSTSRLYGSSTSTLRRQNRVARFPAFSCRGEDRVARQVVRAVPGGAY